ncbi:Intradiol ring-cleavage dioxygenase [Pyronema domesticum]|nr:Intradiol ring-cleavage dioxygenase [Pyronema domesticum]
MIDIWHCNITGIYSSFEAEGTANKTFLRGLQATDEQGVMQMTSIFPGWYSGRATHIHTVAHVGGSMNSNGTYTGGTVAHIGQVFFPEDVLEQIGEISPCSTHNLVRLKNADDRLWSSDGVQDAVTTEITPLGDKLEDGVMAHILIGLDLTADYSDDLVSGVQGGWMPSGGTPSGNRFNVEWWISGE